MTTREKIKTYLERGFLLTSFSAFKLFNTVSLPQHINALRNQGVDIETKMEKAKTGTRFAIYFIRAD